jgi:hypothetical protein
LRPQTPAQNIPLKFRHDVLDATTGEPLLCPAQASAAFSQIWRPTELASVDA